MSQWPGNILPSPNLSHRSEQSQSQKSLRSQGSIRGQANGMPIAESRSLEAAHILDQLQKEIVFLTGGRDRQGGPLLVFPPCRDEYFMPNDISACLRYLIQIPSDESKRRGFTAIVDSRDGSWSNLVTLLGCLKQSLGDYLKQVLVLRSDGMGPRHSSSSSFRRDRGPNIEPQFINLNRLYTFVDRNQLIGSMGGTLMYRHSYWLQNRLDLEKFVRESRAAASHLDSAESEITHRYRSKGPESPTSPVEALRQHQFFQDSTLSVPKQVIRDGRDLLHKLQQYNEAAMPGDGSVTTLDNLESQKQVKRTLQYIENRIDKIQNFLQEQDRSLHMNVLRDELQKEFRQVVEWILGPGEKLLASQTDIGDSFETAEVLRKRFEELEIKCADTYGHYAELRHRAEDLVRDHHASSDDIRAQRDYMDTVCRSFASRLERRRTLLITSVRFHRLTEEFTRKLDDLLGFLYDDREADTVETAQEALRQLQEKVDAIDTAANHGMRDGQSLLDEMTRPIKNAFGKDISPDYAHQIKHITQKLEELQERKMRCDDLAEVRKLKLQQTLQLRTCERDVDQAINWILELYDVMVTSHTNLGQTVQETETLHDEHRKFESAASGTYDYGKQLLQAAQVLRRSLRFELEPYNLRAQRLEDAWKKFSRGTSERANRLTVAAMFIGQSDKVYEGVEQLMVVVAQTLTGDISVLDALSRYGPEKQRVELEHQDTDQMGRALLERLALPLVTTDGMERPLSQDEQGSTDMINGRLRKMAHKVAELNRYWSEMEQTGQPPSVQPKITRSMQSRPQGQPYYQGQGEPYSQGQRSTLPHRSQSQRSQDAGPYRGRDQPIRTHSLNKPESHGRGRVRKRPIPKQSSRRSTGEPVSASTVDRPDVGQMNGYQNGYHSLPSDRSNIPFQDYFEGPDSRPHVSQSFYPRSEEFIPNIGGSSNASRGPGEERFPPVPPVRNSSFRQNQGPAYQSYRNDDNMAPGQTEWGQDYQPYQTSETRSRTEPAMPLNQLESQILPSKSTSQSFSPQIESQIQPDVSNRSYSAIPKTYQKESRADTVPRRSEGSHDRSYDRSRDRSGSPSKTEPKVQKLDMGKFKMFEQTEPVGKYEKEKEKSKSLSHLHKKPDEKGGKDSERTRSASREKESEKARSTSHLHMKPDTLPKLQAYGQPDIMRSSLPASTTQGAPVKRLYSKRVDEDPINFRELLTKFQSPQEEEVVETEEKKIVQAELNQVLASRAKVLEDLENEDLPRAVRRLKKDMDEVSNPTNVLGQYILKDSGRCHWPCKPRDSPSTRFVVTSISVSTSFT